MKNTITKNTNLVYGQNGKLDKSEAKKQLARK